MRVRWTQAALDDFKTISQRIEQGRNLATANRVCRHIYDSIQTFDVIRKAGGCAKKTARVNWSLSIHPTW